jgi:hypothetical protein
MINGTMVNWGSRGWMPSIEKAEEPQIEFYPLISMNLLHHIFILRNTWLEMGDGGRSYIRNVPTLVW